MSKISYFVWIPNNFLFFNSVLMKLLIELLKSVINRVPYMHDISLLNDYKSKPKHSKEETNSKSYPKIKDTVRHKI